MEFIADATKERYLFLKRFYSPESIIMIGAAKRIPDAERLQSQQSQPGHSLNSEEAKALVRSLSVRLAQILADEPSTEWVSKTARNIGDTGFHFGEFNYRGPFLGLHLTVRPAGAGALEVTTDGQAIWNQLYSETQTRLQKEENFANVKYYLILRTVWDLSNYAGSMEKLQYCWEADKFMAEANNRMHPSAGIKRVAYLHFDDLTAHPTLLFKTSGNSPTRGVFPERLPVVKALLDWFQETYPDRVRKYTRLDPSS